MNGPDAREDATAPDLSRLAEDWIALWQSELAALAADREAREMWRSWLAVWAGVAAIALKTLPHDQPAGRGGSPDAPRPASAAAASDPRDAEIDRLARRISELERRIASLERGRG